MICSGGMLKLITGFYCPDSRSQIICPEGSYCPTGYTAPVTCSLFASCPEGSTSEIFYGGLLLCLIVDVILVLAKVYLHFGDKKRQQFINKSFSSLPSLEMGEASSKSKKIRAACGNLIDAFQKAMFNQSLRLSFEFKDIKLTSKAGVTILNDINGFINPGRFTVIMGPSGFVEFYIQRWKDLIYERIDG